MSLPTELFLAFTLVEEADCPHCGEHPCRCAELEMRAEAEANIDAGMEGVEDVRSTA